MQHWHLHPRAFFSVERPLGPKHAGVLLCSLQAVPPDLVRRLERVGALLGAAADVKAALGTGGDRGINGRGNDGGSCGTVLCAVCYDPLSIVEELEDEERDVEAKSELSMRARARRWMSLRPTMRI